MLNSQDVVSCLLFCYLEEKSVGKIDLVNVMYPSNWGQNVHTAH